MLENSSTGAVEMVGDALVRRHGKVWTAPFRWRAAGEKGAGRRGVISCVLVGRGRIWMVEHLQNTLVARRARAADGRGRGSKRVAG
jgi:hypothetical protein